VTLALCFNSSTKTRDPGHSFSNRQCLHGKFRAGREPVHLTPQISVVFFGCLEEFHVPIRAGESARVADGLHFGSAARLKAACDFEILVQHA
jgi:hypothetical protein